MEESRLFEIKDTIVNISELLKLYNESFLRLKTTAAIFAERLSINSGSKIITVSSENELFGYSVVNADGILLLCVKKQYRNKGIGSALMKKSENIIKENYQAIKLGASQSGYLLVGVPLDDEQDFHAFFEKRGYHETWVSYDMVIDLRKFIRKPELDNADETVIIRKRLDTDEDRFAAKKCGDAIKEGWGNIYESASNLLVAEKCGEIIGAVTVEPEYCLFPHLLNNAGSFGCLGVREDYQKQGIGMKLCQDALCELKASGCDICHIGYTWLDWWYGKLGAEKFVHYWMGEKSE